MPYSNVVNAMSGKGGDKRGEEERGEENYSLPEAFKARF